ncbi:serine/threonine protein kinase [Nitzschia inconspicua]|uniref:Serine/threonine protein kinase n=1 Tax=Nitzschia inconspicua TaxID=303405 RepID=A0A9K3K5Q2_9STRA|nr:serine/threonine protein kinase [Nitzschia inconspicua]KAG7361192.1 serine/threonine protein kinase [Nitzschia inconspicua]
MMEDSNETSAGEVNGLNGAPERNESSCDSNGHKVDGTKAQDDTPNGDVVTKPIQETAAVEMENGLQCISQDKAVADDIPGIATMNLNDVETDMTTKANQQQDTEALVEEEEVDVAAQAQEPQTTTSTTPQNSPPRASSLSSTPDRPSSLSSTPERPSSLTSTPERIPSNSSRPDLQLQEDDTWSQITKRDRQLTNANAIAVMDHAHTVLAKRICEASDQLNLKESLTIFDKSLARFQNSEIKLGRRIASGNFADIFQVTSFVPVELETKACTQQQKDAAEGIKVKYKPGDLVIKVLRGNLLLNPSLYATAAADFITEGTLLSALDHPHIVAMRGRSVPTVEGFASGKRDSVFLMLERLHGDLTHKVRQWRERQSQNRIIIKGLAGRRDGRATILRERVQAMMEVADALNYLHDRNIIHRDLKLSNVGVDASGRMKLLDFGLAKILPTPSKDGELFHLTGNTGSVRYMAPEVARGETYNLKADVYSFSILLYEVMNLDKAFQGWQPRDISDRVHHKKHRPRLPLIWPSPVRDLIKATWSDIPAGRLSMKHVYAVLQKESEELQNGAEGAEME